MEQPAALTPEQLAKIEANRQLALAKLAERKRLREQETQTSSSAAAHTASPYAPAASSSEKRQKLEADDAEPAAADSSQLVCEACGANDGDTPGGAVHQKLREVFDVTVCRKCADSNSDYHCISKVSCCYSFTADSHVVRHFTAVRTDVCMHHLCCAG
jgi:hypothetical protein